MTDPLYIKPVADGEVVELSISRGESVMVLIANE